MSEEMNIQIWYKKITNYQWIFLSTFDHYMTILNNNSKQITLFIKILKNSIEHSPTINLKNSEEILFFNTKTNY